MSIVIEKFKELFMSDDSNGWPEKDQHEDESAEIGDERYFIMPFGELFGYEKEYHVKQIEICRQRYSQNGTYTNGKKSYGWRDTETIFRGTVEDWEEHKKNPEKYRKSIPVD